MSHQDTNVIQEHPILFKKESHTPGIETEFTEGLKIVVRCMLEYLNHGYSIYDMRYDVSKLLTDFECEPSPIMKEVVVGTPIWNRVGFEAMAEVIDRLIGHDFLDAMLGR